MNTVKVIVRGAGSLVIEGPMEPKDILFAIRQYYVGQVDFKVMLIKRGPRPKVKNEEKATA